MSAVMCTVRSRVVPPAPYVTDTNVGCSGSSSRSAVHSWRSPASSLGGKNSKEIDRSPAAISSLTRREPSTGLVDWDPSVIRNSIGGPMPEMPGVPRVGRRP